MATFPMTTKYFLRFRHSDTGLTPSFAAAGCYFKRADTLANITPPTVVEVAGGTYYFEHTWATAADPDIIFQVDGGASIPTEEVRYVADTISPRDFFLDMASSDISTSVWGDRYDYAFDPPAYNEFGNPKGAWLANVIPAWIGDPNDDNQQETIFGRIQKAAVVDVMGGMWGGVENSVFFPGNNIKQVYDRLGNPNDYPDVGYNTIAGMLYGTYNQIINLPSIIMGYTLQGENTVLGPTHLEMAGTGFVSASHSLRSIAENMGGITGSVDVSLASMQAMLQRALGMLHENSVLDQTSFSGGNLASARLRLYDSAANAAAAQAASNQSPPAEYDTGKIAVYAINATYTGANLKDYLVTLEWLH